MAEEIQILFFGDDQSGKTQLLNCIFFNREFDKYNAKQDAKGIDDTDILLNFNTSTTPVNKVPIALYCVDLSKHLNQELILLHLNQFAEANPASSLFVVGTKEDACPADHAYRKFQNLRQLLANNHLNFRDDRFFITSAYKSASKKPNLNNRDPKQDVIEQGIKLFNEVIRLAVRKSELAQRSNSAFITLKSTLNKLPSSQQKRIESALRTLKQKLTHDELALADKEAALVTFTNTCNLILKGKHPKVMAAIMAITAIIAIGLVAATVTCGIGLLAGAWAGPIALLQAFASGSLATNAVAAGSGLAGIAVASKLVSHGMFKTNNTLGKIEEYVSALRDEKTVQL